ncbi:MAG: diaminopimelate epimerase [Deltaproteobacteria bacterium]|nr:diaminopimelate epimerase [Deltaproteobacteria bacterium]
MSNRSSSFSEARSENDLEFIKMQGCGNNFVVTSDFRTPALPWDRLTIGLMDRNFGIGGDGVMVLRPANSSKYDFEVLMYNPDGSPMGMCGNGIRCVARFAMLNELIPPGREVIHFLVEGRDIACALRDGGNSVMVDMGPPAFEPEAIPVRSDQPVVNEKISLAGQDFTVSCVSMGNPHCVIFVPDVEKVDLLALGPKIENDPFFPKRTNVEFVQVRSPKELVVRVWERGAGATLACGTAACAVIVAASKTGRTDSSATVILPGGSVEVEWDQGRNTVYLTGPAKEVFFGRLRIDSFLNGRTHVN